MNAVTLTMRSVPPLSIDARSLSPMMLQGRTEPEIAAMALPMGRQRSWVGDWFEVRVQSSASAEACLRLVGDCRCLDHVGYDLRSGTLIVDGDVGHAVGHHMRSGIVRICGSAGDHVGMSMRGGCLSIEGNVGDYLGGPAGGQRSGMSGGQIVVAGDAASHLGYRLRRGTIVVIGGAGPHVAADMVAGTVAIGGVCDRSMAAGMRRGTILLCHAPQLPRCGFTEPRRETPSMQALLIESICRLAGPGSPFSGFSANRSSDLLRSIGDRAVGGMGEVVWQS